MMSCILHHFDIPVTALLGKGSESQVYALDSERVLRLYALGASLAAIEARHQFYRELAAQHPPFVLPTVLDQGVIDGIPYSIELRMRGQDFASVLPQLTGRDRERALRSYLHLATQISTTQFPDAPFGELILPEGMQRDTWPDFLWDRAQQTLQHSRSQLQQDVPHLERLLVEFRTRLVRLGAMQTKSLVHGDYFPGNVFIDDTLTVYAVGDFGYSTLVGDQRMDIAGAIIFLEVVEGYQASDTELLLDVVRQEHADVSADRIELYRLYYSFYFSHCKDDDPTTYAWCIRNLQRYAGM